MNGGQVRRASMLSLCHTVNDNGNDINNYNDGNMLIAQVHVNVTA
uniref:Uncharacterized protein n=1 Tax=Anguilla anguilla TaxID=7936 RepID=A0A0E9RU94_ANGAN